MKAKLKQARYFCVALALFLLFTALMPLAASAATNDGSRLVVYHGLGDVYDESEFRLYRVATAEGNNLKFTDKFTDSMTALSQIDESGTWADRAETLENYVVSLRAKGNDPEHFTGSKYDGYIQFDNLPNGLYLLVLSQKTVNGYKYTVSPSLFYVPNTAEISLKHGREKIEETKPSPTPTPTPTPVSDNPTPTPSTPVTGTMSLSVVKIWEDESDKSDRPDEVTVTLYRNEKEYSTVTLNAANSWKYTWTVPDDNSQWNLVEKDVPEHYTFTSVKNGKTFVVTNTHEDEVVTPTPSESPAQPTEPPSSAPTATPTPTTPVTSSKLPQTGQLWWPVSLLAACGLITLLIGVGIRKRGKDSHE